MKFMFIVFILLTLSQTAEGQDAKNELAIYKLQKQLSLVQNDLASLRVALLDTVEIEATGDVIKKILIRIDSLKKDNMEYKVLINDLLVGTLQARPLNSEAMSLSYFKLDSIRKVENL